MEQPKTKPRQRVCFDRSTVVFRLSSMNILHANGNVLMELFPLPVV
jgi:hypothetical protein